MWKQVLFRGFSDSFNFLGGWQVIIALIAIPVVGFAFHWQSGEPSDVFAEFSVWITYGLKATGAVFLVILVWNVASAPYRIVRDDRDKLREKFSGIDSTESDFTPLLERNELSLGLIASLMSSNEREEAQYLKMLKDDVLYRRLSLSPSSNMIAAKLIYLRNGLGGIPPSDQEIPKTVLVERKELARYFRKYRIEIPQWLKGTEEETPR